MEEGFDEDRFWNILWLQSADEHPEEEHLLMNKYLLNRSSQEIADESGHSVPKINSDLLNARRKLREFWEKNNE